MAEVERDTGICVVLCICLATMVFRMVLLGMVHLRRITVKIHGIRHRTISGGLIFGRHHLKFVRDLFQHKSFDAL
jgi:hypothetical protein